MGAREKYTARPFGSTTTFTRFGSVTSARSSEPAAVPSTSPRSRQAIEPLTDSFATKGSSPCTFTMNVKSLKSCFPMTSATRSVPERCSGDVSTASNPARSTTFAISLASVATTTRSHRAKSVTRRTTWTTRGSPASGRSGLRGRRLEPSRAGITPRTGTEEDTKCVPRSLDRSLHDPQEVLQQALPVLGPDGFGVELDPVDGVLAVLHGHDFDTVPGAVGAHGGDHERGWQRLRLDHQGVVA